MRKAFFRFGADSFENGTWERDLIHEYTHFEEGTDEYEKLGVFLADKSLTVDTKNGKRSLAEVAAESVLSKGYGFTAEEIGAIIDKKQAGKDLTAEEADKYSVFNDELMAHATEHLLGNEAFINKLVSTNAPLARKVFDKLVDVCKAIGGNAASKTLRTAQKLYIKAAEQSGNTRLAKYFLSHAPEIEEEESLDSESEVQYNRKSTTVKKKKQTYSQYYSTAMQWAFSSKTKPGDIKVLYNPSDNTWNKLVADETEDRYGTLLSIEDVPKNAEVIKNLHSEVYNENHGEKQRASESVRENYERYWDRSSNLGDDNFDVEEQDTNGRSREFYGEESGSDRSGDSNESARNRRAVKFSRKSSTGATLTEAQAEHETDKPPTRNADIRFSRKARGGDGEDLYIATDRFVQEVVAADRDLFARSLANKTADIAEGEVRTITIYAGGVYVFKADGYMHGRMLRKSKEIFARRKITDEINTYTNTPRVWSELDESPGRRVGSSVFPSRNGRGTNEDDFVSQRKSARNQPGDSERAGENHRTYTSAEIAEILRKLKTLYGIPEQTAKAKASKKVNFSLKSPNPSGTVYEVSDGQIKKMVANYTRAKTYSKKEADEAIHEILLNSLYSDDERVMLRGKARKEVVSMILQSLNTEDFTKRDATARKVADYIVEHAVLEGSLEDINVQIEFFSNEKAFRNCEKPFYCFQRYLRSFVLSRMRMSPLPLSRIPS